MPARIGTPRPTSSMMMLNRRERARMRLAAQGLTALRWRTAAEAVRAFGVMQGQDLHSVRRSLALRAPNESDNSEIVRGYAMRNTLFAASVKDMGWITELCAKPRKGDAAVREAVLQLIDAPLTRAELKSRAAQALPELPFWHVVRISMESGHACYAGEEQLITPVELDGMEALFNGDSVAATTELMTRYFRTHGPATVQDFAWWCKLPQRLIRPAAEKLPDDLIRIGREGEELVSAEVLELPEVKKKKSVLLLGAFDEYILGYQDRLFAMSADMHHALVPGNQGIFRRAIVIDGQVRGMWNKQGIEDWGIPAYAAGRVERQWKEC